jgi:hypothetical protein
MSGVLRGIQTRGVYNEDLKYTMRTFQDFAKTVSYYEGQTSLTFIFHTTKVPSHVRLWLWQTAETGR